MNAPYNPFARQQTAQRWIERAFIWSLRLSTYGILLAASFIFYLIVSKGGGYVLQPRNFPFLTESPESLRILGVEAQSATFTQNALDNAFRFTPKLAFYETARKGETVHKFSIREQFTYALDTKRVELSDAVFLKLKSSPAEAVTFEESQAKLITFNWKKSSYQMLDSEYAAFLKKHLALDSPNEREGLEGQFSGKLETPVKIYKVTFTGNSGELNAALTLNEDGKNLLVADPLRLLSPTGTRTETYVTGNLASQIIKLGDRCYRVLRNLNPALVLRSLQPGVETATEKSQVYAAGGVFPNIVGTILLTAGSIVIALTLGIMAAIYLSEYGQQGPFLETIRLAILNLSGVPSIVFGMFGYGMFVILFGWNTSLMAGWFTLAFMVLPIIITASEESLRAVPQGYREASLALGATKWQTIQSNVLPYALPGILTSSVLGIARVAGETAPIMFTAAYVVRDELPWDVSHFSDFFFQGVMALPYHIFVVSAKVPQNEYTEEIQYATAFVFLAVVMVIALASILLRNRARNRLKW